MNQNDGELQYLREEVSRLRDDVSRLRKLLSEHGSLPSPYTLQKSTSLHTIMADAAAKRRKKRGY